MGNGMNRVLPGLFVGNYRDSKDAGQLERHKITHIIAIHDAARRLHSEVEYLCICASDKPNQNLAQFFPVCNDFIHNARIQGGSVLIHCLAGMSRSVTIVVAYLMSITSLRWNEALKVVRGARAVSNPNSGFQKQLQEFENTKLFDERRRIQEKFEGTLELDEENCQRLLVAYDHLLLSKAICDGRCATARICPTGTCRAHSSRFSRQKSTSSEGSGSGSISSTRGSTKSLDSSGSETSSSSPRNWERHYGCWRSHVRNQPGPSSTSTPASPILYRASKSPSRRSDSMLSISSITSLPGQISLEKESPSPSTRSSRNSHLSTQSCPNSPRRMPKSRMAAQPPPLAAHSELGTLGSIGGSGGVSAMDVMRLLEKEENDRKIVIQASTSSLNLPSTSTAAGLIASSSRSPDNDPGTESSPTTSGSGTSTSPPTKNYWGKTSTTSACHRFLAHSATAQGDAPTNAPAPTSSARNTIKMARGITRWVMKRSAYKFLDKS